MTVETKGVAKGPRTPLPWRAAAWLACGLATALGGSSKALASPAADAADLVDSGVLVAQPGRQSWDYLFGGVPDLGIASANIGYPGMPRLEYHHTLLPGYSIGGGFALDLGYYLPEGGVQLGMLLTAPMRLSLLNRGKATIGMRFEPGLGFFFEPDFNFAVLANVGVAFGARVSRLITVGGGIDLPIAIAVDPFVFALPILFGPMFEVHPTSNLAITVDFKMGPGVLVNEFTDDVQFALKLAIGAAYRF